jgi:4,5-DOPA dioxygenase extradiol
MVVTKPSLFISHGGPNIVLEDTPARRYLQTLSQLTGKPDAIVIASAHFASDGAVVVADPAPGTIYDFGGFPEELYSMIYPAPGDPELADKVVALLDRNGLRNWICDNRGFDHGVWTPLKLAFPEADIPVVQISIDPNNDARYHYELGKALAPLRQENVLIVGSGHITHNLRSVFSAMRDGHADEGNMTAKVDAFTDWFADKLGAHDHDALMDWEKQAPYVRDNHPTDEHLMPLFFAYGAGGSDSTPSRVHDSRQFGFFAFDSWMFA